MTVTDSISLGRTPTAAKVRTTAANRRSTISASRWLPYLLPLAVVTVASVSTDTALSAWSSTFRRTLMPASGDHTRTVTRVFWASKGSLPLHM